jgi:hypothetical protein
MSTSRSTPAWIRLTMALAALAASIIVATRLIAPAPYEAGAAAAAAQRSAEGAANRQTTATARREADSAALHSHDAAAPSFPQSLPPRGARLPDIYAALQARADAGDPAAASQLYQDVHRCSTVRRYRQLLDRIERDKSPDATGDVGVVEFGADPHARVRFKTELQTFVDASAARCEGVTQEQLDSLFPASLRAAQLGDLNATDCFLGMGFEQMPGLLDHPEWLTEIRDNTPALFDYAIQRGDWVAVELMIHTYAGLFVDTPGAQVFAPDPAMHYRYARLERLGASGDFAKKLDADLRVLESDLTASQIAAGDAWAKDAFQRYFHGSPSNEVSNGANICRIDDD